MWTQCEYCEGIFEPKNWRYRRFCCHSCARYFQHHGKIMDPLQSVADKCANFIINAGTAMGVSPRDLFKYVGSYAALCGDDRFRVCVLVCKVRGIAYTADDEDFRFWPRAKAPEGVAGV